MSCDILFKKVAIKLSDGRIFPMILTGNNRVFVPSSDGNRAHERYARSWCPALWFANSIAEHNKLLWEADEYVNAIKQDIAASIKNNGCEMASHEYAGTRIGSKTATYKQLQSYFCNMTKDAISIEEFIRLNGTLNVSVYTVDWMRPKRDSEQFQTEDKLFCCETEEDLIAMDVFYQRLWKKASAIEEFNCYCVPKISEDVRTTDVRKKRNPVTGNYVVKISHGYVTKITSRSTYYNRYNSVGAKRFPSEKAAQSWVDKSSHDIIRTTGVVEMLPC